MKKCLFDQERNEARESAIALASRTFGLEIWVIAAVILAEVLKNIFYEPIVLGGAVKLHALVVVIGVVGGVACCLTLRGCCRPYRSSPSSKSSSRAQPCNSKPMG